MKSFIIAALVATSSAIKVRQMEQWPSVARCNGKHISSDIDPCDHDNHMAHRHDQVVVNAALV